VPTRRTICLAYRRQPGREAQLNMLREVAQLHVASDESLRRT
jgi:hypothetical protein